MSNDRDQNPKLSIFHFCSVFKDQTLHLECTTYVVTRIAHVLSTVNVFLTTSRLSDLYFTCYYSLFSIHSAFGYRPCVRAGFCIWLSATRVNHAIRVKKFLTVARSRGLRDIVWVPKVEISLAAPRSGQSPNLLDLISCTFVSLVGSVLRFPNRQPALEMKNAARCHGRLWKSSRDYKKRSVTYTSNSRSRGMSRSLRRVRVGPGIRGIRRSWWTL